MHACIEKIEIYLPEKVLTNEDLKIEFPDFEDTKTATKIGIRQRHIAADNETALDMAEKAASKLLAQVDRSEVDAVILCTQSPEYFLPSGACLLQSRLGLPAKCMAFDYNLGCSGFVYGLAISEGLMSAGVTNRILLVMSETYSKHIHPKDKANRSIFGDAAAACLIGKTEKSRFGKFVLYTDGNGYDNAIVKNGGFRNKFDPHASDFIYGTDNLTNANFLYMNGPEIFNFTIEKIPAAIDEILNINGVEPDKIDYYVLHQANKYMLDYLRRKAKIPEDKFYINLQETGNTVSATLPIALHNLIKDGKITSGSKILLVGFGVGLSWGGVIINL